MITDRLLLRVQKLEGAAAMWKEIRDIHGGKTELVQIDLRRRLQETRYDENGDVKTHFSEMLRLRESLAGMGAAIEDNDFYAVVMASLPESYRPLPSSINAAAKITIKRRIAEEYEHRLLADRHTSKKGGNSALSAKANSGGRGKTSSAEQLSPTQTRCATIAIAKGTTKAIASDLEEAKKVRGRIRGR
jgi:hypothetical protein